MRKIYIIEDNTEMLELLTIMLKDINCELVTFNNAKTAIDKLEYEKPDLILCDLLMPEYDGFKFLKEIKNDNNHKDIKVIMLSVVADKKIIDDIMQLGADYFLSKPFRVTELLSLIKKALGVSGNGKAVQ